MKKRLLAALLAAVLTLGLAPAALAAPAGAFEVTVTGEQRYAYAYEVAEQVNALRAEKGLKALVVDEALMDTAMQRAAECAVYYSHTRPDDTRCFDIFPAGRTFAAENIAAGYASPDAVMAGWTNSTGHYKNMTSRDVDAIGVGCFYVGGVCFWAQAFTGGRAASAGKERADQTASVAVPLTAGHLSANMAPEDLDLTLKVGESKKLTVYATNQGYTYAKTPIDNFSRKSLIGGEQIASFDGDTMTLTATAPGTASLTLSLPGGGFRIKLTVLDPDTGFSDVSPDAFYADAVKWAVKNKITSGYGNGLFGPDDKCDRGQIVTFLWRAYGEQEPKSTRNPFTDVTPSDFYYKAVLWAVEKEITQGTTDTTFSPNDPCTRAEAVTFLYRAADRPAASADSSFTDVPAGAWYADAVQWAVENKITGGYGNGLFGSNDNCLRNQIVTFLYRGLAK